MQQNFEGFPKGLGTLEQAVKQFKEKSHTPEVITKYWQTLWKVWGEKINHSFMVPSCDRNAEEIKLLESAGRKLIFVPDELARTSQENYDSLQQIFPKMSNNDGDKMGNIEVRESNKGGWVEIEAGLNSGRLNTAEQLIVIAKKFGNQESARQRLGIYIIGSQDAKLQTGHYFDEENGFWAHLNMGYARFDPNGALQISTQKDDSIEIWNPRAEMFKKTQFLPSFARKLRRQK